MEIDENRTILRDRLRTLVLRGAAAVVLDGQSSFSIVIPILSQSGNGTYEVTKDYLSAIVVKVVNPPGLGSTSIKKLFESMDPYDIIYEKGDEPLPVIRMVISLTSEKPCSFIRRTELIAKNINGTVYDAFDFWCNLNPSRQHRPS